MSNEEFIEGNRLIAKFMGKTGSDNFLEWNYSVYHTSWDWLMPVVEKIQWFGQGERDKTGWTFGMLQFHFSRLGEYDWHCSILGTLNILKVTDGIHTYTKLEVPHLSIYNRKSEEAVWLTVVEFIKWYNQNK